jgi:iron complex transport system substrate-binding protein
MAIVCLLLLVPSAAVAGALQAPPRVEVTDETGRRVSVPENVERVVSLAPNLTELIYALGAERKLVGVTDYCDYPPEARQKPSVGGAVNPSLERILSLKPDLVLATRALNRRETVAALERHGLSVYATAPGTVDDVVESTRRVGHLLGCGERGEELARELRARLASLEQRLAGRARRRALFVVWTDPLMSIGPRTFLADALRRAGADSVIEVEQEWPRLNIEVVVRLQPEFLIFADSHSEKVAVRVAELKRRRGWRNLRALAENRVAVISDAVNRPAPRMISAIEALARQLHPDAFADDRMRSDERSISGGLPRAARSRFAFAPAGGMR